MMKNYFLRAAYVPFAPHHGQNQATFRTGASPTDHHLPQAWQQKWCKSSMERFETVFLLAVIIILAQCQKLKVKS
jgi:hypothetical protein